MTSRTSDGEVGEVLTSAVQQVVQQSKALGLHITQHEDLSASSARVAELTETIRHEAAANLAQLQENHRQQVAKIEADSAALLELLNAEIAAARQQFTAELERMETAHREAAETQRQTLNREHHDALGNSLETTRREREEQRDEYQTLRQQTAANLNLERERMEAAHREAAETQRQNLSREHRAALENSLETIRREREEQRDEYQTLRQQTAANLNLERERMEAAHREAAETQRQNLSREHLTTLENSLETTRRERDQQRNEYEQMRQQTVADLNSQFSQALETSEANFRTATSDATASLNAEHQRSNDAAIAGINTAWTKFTRILIGATAVSSTIAIAALVVVLI